jgi:hypothetical protein
MTGGVTRVFGACHPSLRIDTAPFAIGVFLGQRESNGQLAPVRGTLQVFQPSLKDESRARIPTAKTMDANPGAAYQRQRETRLPRLGRRGYPRSLTPPITWKRALEPGSWRPGRESAPHERKRRARLARPRTGFFLIRNGRAIVYRHRSDQQLQETRYPCQRPLRCSPNVPFETFGMFRVRYTGSLIYSKEMV